MKIRRFILYLIVFTMLISMSVPVFSDEIIEDETVTEETVTENSELIQDESELGEDLFDLIIDANEPDQEETDDIKNDPEQEKVTELSKRESLAVSLMKAIGVFDKNVDLTADFTRAKLAHAIYVLKDYNTLSSSAVNTFADINADTEYVNEISVLYDMGYISGYKGEYRPADTVTASEMAAVLSRILGLEFVVDMKGGWSVGYMNVAHQYDIFDGVTVSTDKVVTTLEAAIIFENLLNAKVEYKNTAGVKGYYMTAVLDISSAEGILTDNGITSIDSSDSIKGRIKIGGVTYNSNGVDCEGYIGKRVKVYYRDVNGDDLYVLAIGDTEKLNTIRINSENIEDFANRTYTYYDGTRTKSVQLAVDYNLVYNGRLVTDGTGLTNEMLKPDEGFVELIDQDNNDRYDLVIIEDYITFIVEEYNANDKVLRSQGNAVAAINFEEADLDIKILIAAGGSEVNVDYQNIAHNGYVLSVARSLDNRAVKIYMAEESVTGYIENLDTADKSVTVNGKEYIASKYLNVSLGGSYKLNINHYGHIIWGQRTELTGDKYAYIEKMYFDDSGENVMLKLYTEDNFTLSAPLSKKAVIDSKRYSDSAQATAVLQNAVGYVVIFRINANDEIVKIDTSTYESGEKIDYSLNILYENTSNPAFSSNLLAFGEQYQSKFPTDFNTKVFCIKEPYETGKIYCYSLADFKSKFVSGDQDVIGKLWLYNTNRDSMIGKVALVKRQYFGTRATTGGGSADLRTGAVVTKIATGINDDNEMEYILTVQRGSKKETVRLEYDALTFNTSAGTHTLGGNNPYSIACGDIIRWGVDDDGVAEAGNVIVLYDCDQDWYNSASGWASRYMYDNRWHYLWIYDKEEDSILSVNQYVSPVEKFDRGEIAFGKLYTYVDYTMPLNGYPISIWVYDKEHNEMREGDLGEFITYKDAGLDCTRVLGFYNSGHRMCIIYK